MVEGEKKKGYKDLTPDEKRAYHRDFHYRNRERRVAKMTEYNAKRRQMVENYKQIEKTFKQSV